MFTHGDKVTSFSRGGCRFKNAKLVIEDCTATIKPNWQSYAFESAFHLASIVTLLFIGSILLEANTDDSMQGLTYLIAFCLGFSALVRIICFFVRKSQYFDLNQRLFYSERAQKDAISIDDITTLQLSNKDVYAKQKSFSCGELCLVTRSGEGVMLLNNEDIREAEYDSASLAKFLSVPLERLRNGEVYLPNQAS
ncbi:hypothetical protein [Echinimonas agarilytica]|uniref:Uncharacterized protein n=1 Tax=Echinimonas agarilytica TaxID=1215918 RepID=A0AA41W545_9GAMM|nr:hypothetical protein [Echinimonas agarilytica]MCM2679174.1 hypothetical protein [Echinimonas agarilytica]